MKKLLIGSLFLFPLISLANLIEFHPQGKIKASEVNYNFNYVKGLIQSKNIEVNFQPFNSGSVVSAEQFEMEFNKVRNLGVSVDPLSSSLIKSSELNTAFSQMSLGSGTIDDIPLSSDFSFTTSEDVTKSGALSFINQTGPSLVNVVAPPLHGTLSVFSGGNYTYTPHLNYFGTDSFSYTISDNLNTSNVAVATINITPVNDAPVLASYSAFSVANNLNYNGNFQIIDPDSSNFVLTETLEPSKGTLVVTNSGSFSYTPSLSSFGADSFKIKVSDGELESSELLVSLNITCGTGFHEEGGSCLNNIRTCSITNGSGTQSWVSGTTYSTCEVSSCLDGFEPSYNNLYCQNAWPNGTTDLVVATGTTMNVNAGDLLNYNNVTINGTLNIVAGATDAITVLGVKGNLIINGKIRGTGNLQGTHSISRVLPNGDNLSYTITQAMAGAGGSDSGGSCGNAGTLGYGGGGSGGTSWGGGGSCGINNGSGGAGGSNATSGGAGGAGGFTGGHGLAGASSAAGGAGGAGGGSGGGGGGASNRADRLYMGGGGGGGGMKGGHGLSLYLVVKGTVSGSGSIELNGTNGFNGGAGGACNTGGGYGGGGGGGGAGGSGGKLWFRGYSSTLPFSLNLAAGLGGSGAAGGCRSATTPSGSGANGNSGSAGTLQYLGMP